MAGSSIRIQMHKTKIRPAVAHRRTGKVWLEGDLERGVVPDSCVWTAGGGAGEDGFLVLLEKMNLELLRRCVWSM